MHYQDIDFLIIGAPRSGASRLQRLLRSDPRIYTPEQELHFFSREYGRGDAWYLERFGGRAGALRVGEKSDSYLESPWAPGRIAKKLPHVRLVAQLRDPVARAYSEYCMLLRRGEAGRTIADHLDPRRAADGPLLQGGLYYKHLSRFLDRFPRDRLLITIHGDLERSPTTVMDRVRGHLGLTEEPAMEERRDAVGRPAADRLLPSPPRPVEPLRGARAFERLQAVLARTDAPPPLDEGLRRRMIEHFAPDIERLSALAGRDLVAEWGCAAAPVRAAE